MLRGTIFGTLGAIAGAAVGWAWPHPEIVVYLPWIVALNWGWVLLVCGPLLMLLGLPLGLAQQAVRPHVSPRLFFPAAVLLGLPFGVLACFLILKFFGKQGNPWTDPTWLFWMPPAVGAGLGLGWGRVQGSTAYD